jgi:hypothetical protein
VVIKGPFADSRSFFSAKRITVDFPWWTLFVSGTRWPAAVVAAGTVLSLGTLLAFPALMVAGHGRRHLDWAARIGDTILGVVWILFAWAILGNVLGVGLAIGGVTDPARSRIVATAVAVVSLVLAMRGYVEAMRVPRSPGGRHHPAAVRALTASRSCCSPTPTGGPIDRALVDLVVSSQRLDADIACHTRRRRWHRRAARRLRRLGARFAPSWFRAYVTGNHEYWPGAGLARSHARVRPGCAA